MGVDADHAVPIDGRDPRPFRADASGCGRRGGDVPADPSESRRRSLGRRRPGIGPIRERRLDALRDRGDIPERGVRVPGGGSGRSPVGRVPRTSRDHASDVRRGAAAGPDVLRAGWPESESDDVPRDRRARVGLGRQRSGCRRLQRPELAPLRPSRWTELERLQLVRFPRRCRRQRVDRNLQGALASPLRRVSRGRAAAPGRDQRSADGRHGVRPVRVPQGGLPQPFARGRLRRTHVPQGIGRPLPLPARRLRRRLDRDREPDRASPEPAGRAVPFRGPCPHGAR